MPQKERGGKYEKDGVRKISSLKMLIVKYSKGNEYILSNRTNLYPKPTKFLPNLSRNNMRNLIV